jgi:hypothetical protein
MINTNIL